MKKRSGSLIKLEKKVKKGKPFEEISQKKECELAELLLQCKEFEEQERMAVKKLAKQERNFFANFLVGIKPVLMVEMAMFKETTMISEMLQDVEKIVGYEKTVFDTSGGMISLVRDKQQEESTSSHLESLFNSRVGSLQSLNSFCGSKLSSSVIMEPSNSFHNECFEPKLIDRTSSLSYDSQDSGIVPYQLTLKEERADTPCMKTSFVPIDIIHNSRYSTVRKSPSPFRSSRLSLSDCPNSRGRVTSKPPLPRRPPVLARSPSIEITENIVDIHTEDVLDIPTEDILDITTEEDQEVLYYMTVDKVRKRNQLNLNNYSHFSVFSLNWTVGVVLIEVKMVQKMK